MFCSSIQGAGFSRYHHAQRERSFSCPRVRLSKFPSASDKLLGGESNHGSTCCKKLRPNFRKEGLETHLLSRSSRCGRLERRRRLEGEASVVLWCEVISLLSLKYLHRAVRKTVTNVPVEGVVVFILKK